MRSEPERYSCVRVCREQRCSLSLNALQGAAKSTGAPVHFKPLPGRSRSAGASSSPPPPRCETSRCCIAHRPVTVTQRCGMTNCNFCCDLHRVSSHHKAFTDTIFVQTGFRETVIQTHHLFKNQSKATTRREKTHFYAIHFRYLCIIFFLNLLFKPAKESIS